MTNSPHGLDALFAAAGSGWKGLTAEEAAKRLAAHPRHRGRPSRGWQLARIYLRQFRSPLVLLLLAAALLSLALRDKTDASIVLGVLFMSTFLGFWQESRAADAVAALLALVRSKSDVLRDGREVRIGADAVVEGDVAILAAGDAVPGDGVILESKDLYVDESSLSGESFPAEKRSWPDAGQDRAVRVYEGTHVVSGTARVLVLKTGANTEWGSLAQELKAHRAETEFDKGLRRFGQMLIQITLWLVLAIFAINVVLDRPVMESFLFALALAVGLAPELMPAIVTITLSRGAQKMAREHVIVRRLASLENFGSMTVLCSDKTGTLTEGRVRFRDAVDAQGKTSPSVLEYAVLNAAFETGFPNPIDQALRADKRVDTGKWEKLDEVPYDFIRKRLSIVAGKRGDTRAVLVTKGAFDHVLSICRSVRTPEGETPVAEASEGLRRRFEDYCGEGYRVIALATRDVTGDPVIDKADEAEMAFEGFVLFEDPPKHDAAAVVSELAGLGVKFTLVTGDNRLAAGRLARQMGIDPNHIITANQLRTMSESALVRRVRGCRIFAEVEPHDKERILLALRRAGEVTGYMGDGINDAGALRAADVGISVDSAVDVARDTADVVLLRHDLKVVAQGIRNGRITLGNTLKYIHITTSANFGNMLSMAGASLFLPFLPLLPKQILLNNFLSDLPALAIATDKVDREQVARPHRWSMRETKRFMLVFGLISSAFDFLLFAVLVFALKAAPELFRTAWFTESLLTELYIILVIRTQRPLYRSAPSLILGSAIVLVTLLAFALPCTPPGPLFALQPLPLRGAALILVVTVLYVAASEATKHRLFGGAKHRGKKRET
ncbi:MAG: magnesium-translocating P-type ATPase [Chthoniobacterales bacterium]|nr:magnesium-translocating P-type ATPase [Chthoniobacterales bacterium]